MIVSTKEHVYFLGEEGTQCRVEQKKGGGGVRMKEKFDIVIFQISIFAVIQHTLSSLHSLVISSIYDHPLNTFFHALSAPTIHDSIG